MSVDPKSSALVIKNAAAAPMIFFDNAPAYGQLGGVVEIELTARVMIPRSDRQVNIELTTTAHLRASPAAMASLRAAIDGALKIAGQEQVDTQAKSDAAMRFDYPKGEPRKPS